jgi:hypothetical protein
MLSIHEAVVIDRSKEIEALGWKADARLLASNLPKKDMTKYTAYMVNATAVSEGTDRRKKEVTVMARGNQWQPLYEDFREFLRVHFSQLRVLQSAVADIAYLADPNQSRYDIPRLGSKYFSSSK